MAAALTLWMQISGSNTKQTRHLLHPSSRWLGVPPPHPPFSTIMTLACISVCVHVLCPRPLFFSPITQITTRTRRAVHAVYTRWNDTMYTPGRGSSSSPLFSVVAFHTLTASTQPSACSTCFTIRGSRVALLTCHKRNALDQSGF